MAEPLLEEARRLPTGAYCRIYKGTGRVGVVALHPWGPLGGSLHDPHVVTVTRFFGHAGCATARLQFRTGFSCGPSPIADTVAAANALLEHVDRVLIVGYSYGSIVAMAAVNDIPEAVGYVAINPPLDYVSLLFLFNSKILQTPTKLPKLLLHATHDQFCANASFDSYFATLPEPKLALRVDSNHFDVVSHLRPALSQWIQAHFTVDVEAFALGSF